MKTMLQQIARALLAAGAAYIVKESVNAIRRAVSNS